MKSIICLILIGVSLNTFVKAEDIRFKLPNYGGIDPHKIGVQVIYLGDNSLSFIEEDIRRKTELILLPHIREVGNLGRASMLPFYYLQIRIKVQDIYISSISKGYAIDVSVRFKSTVNSLVLDGGLFEATVWEQSSLLLQTKNGAKEAILDAVSEYVEEFTLNYVKANRSALLKESD